jgi:hypothetical protein
VIALEEAGPAARRVDGVVSPPETGGKAERRAFPEIKSAFVEAAKLDARIIIKQKLGQGEMLGLTRASHVYISLNRAEGFRMGMIRGDEFWTSRDRHKFFGKDPLF